MRKSIHGTMAAGVLFVTFIVLGSMSEAAAQINVNINIGPPPITVVEPPAVIMIPDTMIYFVPQVEYDVFFYDNYWWSPRGSQWYRASAYNGPWVIIENHSIPAPVYGVPKDYRHRYEKEQHIPYGQWKKQWENQGNKNRDARHGEKREDKQDKHGGGHGGGHGKKGD